MNDAELKLGVGDGVTYCIGSEMLLAFHNDPKIKEKYLDRVEAHRKADEIIHGVYVEKYGKNQIKGCAVGCTLHSNYHANYEIELGIPRILAKLEDRIFESLNHPRDKDWPCDFLKAIPVGADLSNVWPQFTVWMLVDEDWGVLQVAKTDRTKEAIQAIAEFYKSGKYAKPEYYEEIKKIRAAVTAAYADAVAAAYAYAAYADAVAAAYAYAAYAYAAHAVAYADAVAVAVAAVAAVTADADHAAAAHAAAAAKRKWRHAQADKLLELLSNSPVVENR